MSDKYVIEIRVSGEDITPDKMSSRDVGELIASIEQMIAFIVARDNPSLGIDQSQVIVGLASVKQGSYVLQFQTPFEAEVGKAYNEVTDAINEENYNNLPAQSVEALEKVRKFTRKYRTETELWEKNGQYRQLAKVTTNTRIDIENILLRGKTTLYGTVVRVGGENQPTVQIRLLDGNIQTCEIRTQNIARQLGERLYSRVGVRGTATWDRRDMSLQSFRIEQVTSYRQRPMPEVLEIMHNATGQYYEGINDIDGLIADVRGNDGEE
jgi:hypothetical protein